MVWSRTTTRHDLPRVSAQRDHDKISRVSSTDQDIIRPHFYRVFSQAMSQDMENSASDWVFRSEICIAARESHLILYTYLNIKPYSAHGIQNQEP